MEHKNVSIADQVFEKLERDILIGEYNRGDVLTESKLSEILEVSRTPIREAFKQLESEGLMEYIPNRGCFARGFTRRDMHDIYSVRKALEQLAVEWAVERISDEEIESLKSQIDLMEFYTKRNDVKKCLDLDIEFHQTIYGSTRSRFLSQILRSYQDYIVQARLVASYDEQMLKDVLEEHMAILNAVVNRDPQNASEKMRIHLDMSKERAEGRWASK